MGDNKLINPRRPIPNSGYDRLRIKFVTRGEANDMLQQFLDGALAKDDEDTIRIQGIKSMKYRDDTLKRL